MNIFDDIERIDTGLPDYDSSLFQFMNTSGQPEVGKARKLIQDLFDNYPECGRTTLLPRLKSDDQNFNGAVFELILYRILAHIGLAPQLSDLDNSQKYPDFLVSNRDTRIYVEATVHDPKKDTIRLDPFSKDVLNKLDNIDGRGFELFFVTEGTLDKLISKRTLTAPIEQRIDDIINSRTKSMEIQIKEGDWNLTGTLFEVEEGDGQRFVQSFTIGPAKYVNPSKNIKGKISEKAKRYRKLDFPIILAVNSRDLSFDVKHNPISALFGKILWDETVKPPRSERLDNGIWITKNNKPQNTKLAGVLVFRGLDAFELNASMMFYPNPYIDANAIPNEFYRLPHATYYNNSRVEFNDGEKLPDLVFH